MSTHGAPPDDTLSTSSDARSGAAGPGVTPRAQLYLVLEADRPRGGSSRCALDGVDEVTLRRGGERSIERSGGALSIAIADRRLSSVHASIVRASGRFAVIDRGSTNGTFVNGIRVERAELEDGDVIEVGRTFFRFRAAAPTPEDAPLDLDASDVASVPPGLRTLVPSLAATFGAVRTVAASRVPIVVTGETGTGKELFARAVHALSGRAGAFVAVNCGALPEGLVESQLFGHVRGAFSGATRDEAGYVRSSDRGTLFLDEIADLARPSQAALLRALQEHEVTPVGSTRPIAVDLRVACATHADLDALAVSGEFRLDLLARLAGMRVRLPALRDRADELGTLIAELLAAKGNERVIGFEPEAVRALLAYSFPMNARELSQCVALAAALAEGGVVSLAHLPEEVRSCPRPDRSRGSVYRPISILRAGGIEPNKPPRDVRQSLPSDARPPLVCDDAGDDAALREALIAAFREHEGNVSAVARSMGKARMQIQRWMKRFDVDPAAFKAR